MGESNFEDPFRARVYRLLFALAAVYNLAFAAWAIGWPRSFFGLLAIDPPRYPAIWQCLGMVVGVYGLGYAYAARRLDRAFPFIALGLLGKVLGPVGWVATVHSGEWPIRTFTLILFNDVVWWLPFGLFLLEGTRAGRWLRASGPSLCCALNLAAALAMLLALRPGSEAVPDLPMRVGYIAAHPALWRAGWGLWIMAALSLLGFYGWWGARVRSRSLGIAALVLATTGVVGDLLAESLYIGWLPADYDRIATLARFLTGVWGNSLYTVAGILLTLGSPWLRGPARACAWLIWAAGLALAVFALTGNAAGIAASMALLFILFCPWVAWVGLLRGRSVK
ncbi:MAG TPA: hypothetical protein VFT43_01665 [Candidatus Polarisedimenticolia bacterium]|nr:hypothetical protein [Candidatus Polarisedimenticolia bacterium]